MHPTFTTYIEDQIQPYPDSFKSQRPVFIVCTHFEKIDLQDFISKILQAIKIDMNKDAHIWNVTEQQWPQWRDVLSYSQPKFCFFFGEKSSKMGLHINLNSYEWKKFKDIDFLLADSLDLLYSNKDAKLALWNQLQLKFKKS